MASEYSSIVISFKDAEDLEHSFSIDRKDLKTLHYTQVLYESAPLVVFEEGLLSSILFKSFDKDCFMFKPVKEWVTLFKNFENAASLIACPSDWSLKSCFLDGDVIRLKINKRTQHSPLESLVKGSKIAVEFRVSFYFNPDKKSMGLFFDLDKVSLCQV